MARKKSGGKKGGGKNGGGENDKGTENTRDRRFPSEAQLNLVRIVADRHRLPLVEGYEDDLPWVSMFLDCFAYDTVLGTGGSRQIWNVQQWFREQRDPQEIAKKICLTVKHVEFIHDMLVTCGYNVGPIIDNGELLDLDLEMSEIIRDGDPDEIAESLAHRLTLYEELDREEERDLIGWKPERDFPKVPSPIRR